MSRLPFIEGEEGSEHPSPTTGNVCPDSEHEAAVSGPSGHTPTAAWQDSHGHDASSSGSMHIASGSRSGSEQVQQVQCAQHLDMPALSNLPFQELPSAFTSACPTLPAQHVWLGADRRRSMEESRHAVQQIDFERLEQPATAEVHHASPHSFPLPFCGSPRSSTSASVSCGSTASLPLPVPHMLLHSTNSQSATLARSPSDRPARPRMKTSSSGSHRKHWAFAHLPMPSRLASRSTSPPPAQVHGVLPKVLVPKDATAQQLHDVGKQLFEPLRMAAAGPAVVAEFQDCVCEYMAHSHDQNVSEVPSQTASTTRGERAAGDAAIPVRDTSGVFPWAKEEPDAKAVPTRALFRPLPVPASLCPPQLLRRFDNIYLDNDTPKGSHSCPASPGHASASKPQVVFCPVHGVVSRQVPPPLRGPSDGQPTVSDSSSGRSTQIFLPGSPLPYDALVGPQVSRYFSAPGDLDVECFCGSCPDLSIPLRPSKSLVLNLRPRASFPSAVGGVGVGEAAECEDMVDLLAHTPTLHWRRQSGEVADVVHKKPAKLELSYGALDGPGVELRRSQSLDAGDTVHSYGGSEDVVQGGSSSVNFNALPGAEVDEVGFDKGECDNKKEPLFGQRQSEMFSEEWSNMVLTSAVTSADPSYDSHNVLNLRADT